MVQTPNRRRSTDRKNVCCV